MHEWENEGGSLGRFSNIHLEHYTVQNRNPPQKQCHDKDDHIPHTYEDEKKGLIWSCQGKGN